MTLSSSASASSAGSDSTSSVRRRRLLLSEDEDDGRDNGAPTKRFKTTGEADDEGASRPFRVRQLGYSDRILTSDEIHNSIEICPVMKAFVDTEAFQRLRGIKQLGTVQWTYDCANGNRFQHSLGVACLAEKMCLTVKAEQPEFGTTDKDVLCVKLAGLLHDIGHGPCK
jgi:HD-GYP domain-containing protein (c-di-GMP phosphodiesterase class II)